MVGDAVAPDVGSVLARELAGPVFESVVGHAEVSAGIRPELLVAPARSTELGPIRGYLQTSVGRNRPELA